MAKRILWVCFHRTHRFEEVNLLLEAGFEVIPVKDPENNIPTQKWQLKCTLSNNIINELRSNLTMHFGHMRFNKQPNQRHKELINKHIDIILLASFIPEVPEILKWFKGKVIFRAFGHGDINNYTNICNQHKIPFQIFNNKQYVWSPICDSLDAVEKSILTNNKLTLTPIVTLSRLLTKWKRNKSSRIICNVISKAKENPYYQQVYNQYIKNYGDLPLMILGKNKKSNDPRLIGTLNNQQYYHKMASARLMIYHTANPYHLHYHPMEAIRMNIPVLFHCNSIVAYEFKALKLDPFKYGCYRNVQEARKIANQCLNDIDYAIYLSEQQKIINHKIFNKERALKQIKKLNI